MKKTLDAQKAKVKEELCKMIDNYYDEFSKQSEEPNFTIDQIERLMLGQRKKVREILSESNSEITSSIEASEKKMP